MSDVHMGPHGSIGDCPTGRFDRLGFEVHAKIEKEDIEWMAHCIEDAFLLLDEVDIILIMRNYDGAELSAVFNMEALKSQAEAAKHVRKYAVVGAPVGKSDDHRVFAPVARRCQGVRFG